MLPMLKKLLASFGQTTDSKMPAYCRCSPRLAHVAFTDGENMFIYGGYCTNTDTHIEAPDKELMLYSSSLDVWTSKTCTGEVPSPTLSGTSVAVIYPYAYFIAGFQDSIGHTSEVYRMHLQTLVWEIVLVDSERYMSPRDKFASWVYNDKIYCFGGWGSDPLAGGLNKNGEFVHGSWGWFQGEMFGWNNQLLIFDPSTATWANPQCQGPVPSARAAHTASVIGNCAYIFGGRHMDNRLNDIHCLHLDSLTWSGAMVSSSASNIQPSGRSWHTASVISDHEIFIYGGYDQTECVLGDGWIFDTSTLSWSQIVKHNSHCRLWHTAVVTNNGDILVYGGSSASIKRSNLAITDYSDQVIRFQFQPYSLLKICCDFVAENSQRNKWLDMCEPMRGWLTKRRAILACLKQGTEVSTPQVLNGFLDTTVGRR